MKKLSGSPVCFKEIWREENSRQRLLEIKEKSFVSWNKKTDKNGIFFFFSAFLAFAYVRAAWLTGRADHKLIILLSCGTRRYSTPGIWLWLQNRRRDPACDVPSLPPPGVCDSGMSLRYGWSHLSSINKQLTSTTANGREYNTVAILF